MAGAEEVDEYQRTTKSGQVVTVRAHSRVNSEVATTALALPGRPPLAAKPGSFANGRSIPGVWPDPDKIDKEAEEQAAAVPTNDEVIDFILGKTPSLKSQQTVQAAARWVLDADDGMVEL